VGFKTGFYEQRTSIAFEIVRTPQKGRLFSTTNANSRQQFVIPVSARRPSFHLFPPLCRDLMITTIPVTDRQKMSNSPNPQPQAQDQGVPPTTQEQGLQGAKLNISFSKGPKRKRLAKVRVSSPQIQCTHEYQACDGCHKSKRRCDGTCTWSPQMRSF
jgi:hypothetical protein